MMQTYAWCRILQCDRSQQDCPPRHEYRKSIESYQLHIGSMEYIQQVHYIIKIMLYNTTFNTTTAKHVCRLYKPIQSDISHIQL